MRSHNRADQVRPRGPTSAQTNGSRSYFLQYRFSRPADLRGSLVPGALLPNRYSTGLHSTDAHSTSAPAINTPSTGASSTNTPSTGAPRTSVLRHPLSPPAGSKRFALGPWLGVLLGILLGASLASSSSAAETDASPSTSSSPPARAEMNSENGSSPDAETAPTEVGEADLQGPESDAPEEYEESGAIDHPEIEEMLIHGTANSGTLAPDAAESAVQFDAQELTALGVTDISDIAKVTPNLEITKAGATSANFFIRGVGLADYSANSASAVAIYQNGVPLNAAALQLVGLFDIASVEVLRGPQGAGSARNASAGAIKIIPRKPTGELRADLKVTIGAYESDVARNALIQDYEGALEMPLIEDVLSARFAFRARTADPFMTNGCGDAPPLADRVPNVPGPPPSGPRAPGVNVCGEKAPPQGGISDIPTGLPSAVGDQGNWALRGLFRLEPEGSDSDWLLSIHGGRLDQQSTLGQAIGTNPRFGRSTVFGYFEPDIAEERQPVFVGAENELRNGGVEDWQSLANEAADSYIAPILVDRPLDIRPYRGDYNRVGQTTRDSWGTSLNGRLFLGDFGFLGPVELETTTGYDGYERNRDTDQDFTPNVLFETVQSDAGWQLFQELKATGENDDGSLQWNLGSYFLMEELDFASESKTRNEFVDSLRTFTQSMKSVAVYAGFDWDFLDDFTLSAGARYNWEEKDFDLRQILSFSGNLVGDVPVPQSSTWSAPTGLLSLTYRFNDDVSAYWKFSRGWKGGHYNANRAGEPPAQPESVDSLEAGFRGAWFDNRLSVSGAIFYYNYKNYQLFLFENAIGTPPILEIINAGSAQQYGAELEFEIMPLQDWDSIPESLADFQVFFRGGWLASEFLDFVNTIEIPNPVPGRPPVQQEVVYTGNRLPNAPEFKVSGGASWPLDLGRFGTITPRYDFAWSGEIFFDANEGRGSRTRFDEELAKGTIAQPAHALHNFRLSWYNADDTIQVSGWVRNLTDVRYKTFAFDATIFANVILNFVGEPRTAGVDVVFRF